MAINRAQAWLIGGVTEDTVPSAILLAGSLRRTRTRKRLGVIIGDNVSKEGRLKLRAAFDDLFCMDETLVPCAVAGEIREKIFALSLEIYTKCIFLRANTVVLENIDHLFQVADDPADPFIFQPSLELCKYLVLKLENLHLKNDAVNMESSFLLYTNEWKQNNNPSRPRSVRGITGRNVSIAKFSVAKAQFLLAGTNFNTGHPSFVEIVDVPKTYWEFATRMKCLRKTSTHGLAEKMFVEVWNEMHDDQDSKFITNFQPPQACIPNRLEMIYQNEPIAIVGMSCRFPGAKNLNEFWELLHSGRDAIGKPPPFRWGKDRAHGTGINERNTNAGFLSVPIDEFDIKFFGMSPKEALLLDPQARLLQEVVWESLECSGIDPLRLRGSSTGIFTGSWMNEYKDYVQATSEGNFFRTYMGNSIGATAARLSFLLGLTGPSIATESGCSSAIVAVHTAIKSLRTGESNLALAGGVNLFVHPFTNDISEHVIAPDGLCKTFDEKANGFGRAEGCGVIVLKRLSDALENRDNICAVIRGSAISQEGLSRSLGTPTVHSEALAMKLALKDAGVLPEQVSFVETHGTGTSVGDPMEVAAMAEAYHTKSRKVPLIIGSVKTNVGHTESCSGITGIIKTVLAMQNELIPKHLNLQKLNPEVDLDAIPAQIPIESIPWPKIQGHPRFASVSSFGITGTDGHVILEEAPDYQLPKFHFGLERPLHLIKFSVKSKEALDDLLKDYENYFSLTPQKNLANAAYTANSGRANFSHRAFILASDYQEAFQQLQMGRLERNNIQNENCTRICFLFTGQGSQYPGMAMELYETSPVFRVNFDGCDRFLVERYKVSISQVIFESTETSPQKLSRTMYSQVSIFCVEFCLLKLWESWGIRPDCVLGHSLGEFCAAVAAGIMSFEDALMLVAERSRLIDGLPGGRMLVVKATKLEVENLLVRSNIDLDFAAVNSNEQTVVAGDTEQINGFQQACTDRGLKSVVLEATHAFHSRHMDTILAEYRSIAERVRTANNVGCQYISGVTGELLNDPSSEINANYWVKHTRDKVAFQNACKVLRKQGYTHFLEIGSQPVLSSLVLQNMEDIPVSIYPSLRRNAQDWKTVLTSLGKLYTQGFRIDWEGFDRPYIRKRIPASLPFHPFHRKPFWIDCSEETKVSIHPLIGSILNNASAVTIFENNFNIKTVPYMLDHCIGNMILMPGAAFAEICLAAGYCAANSLSDKLDKPRRAMSLENLAIVAPFEIKSTENYQLQVIVDLNSSGNSNGNEKQHGFRVQVFRRNERENEATGKWLLHAHSTFYHVANTKHVVDKWNPGRVKEIIDRSCCVSTKDIYKRIHVAGIKFGENFKSIERYWMNEPGKEIVAEMKIPKDHEDYLLHPVIIDAALQSMGFASILLKDSVTMNIKLPVRIGKLIWLDNISANNKVLYLNSWLDDNDEALIFILNEDLTPVAFLSEVELIDTTVRTIRSVLEQQTRLLPDSWKEIWKPIAGPHHKRVDLSIMDSNFLRPMIRKRFEEIENDFHRPEYEILFRKVNRLIYLYILKTLFLLGWKPQVQEDITVTTFCKTYGIEEKFSGMIHFYFSMFEEECGILEICGEKGLDGTEWIIKRVNPKYLERVRSETESILKHFCNDNIMFPIVKVYEYIAGQLAEMLCGKKSILNSVSAVQSVMDTDSDDGMETYYKNHPNHQECTSKICATIDVLCQHLNSEATAENRKPAKVLRILEIGAGTGSMSAEILPIITKYYGNDYEYYVTYFSANVLSKAKKRLKEFEQNLKFRVFDIEESPLEQGIPINYFDIIIASHGLHAATNLKQRLTNLRQLLRPHGILCFIKHLTQDRGLTFAFGMLDGNWRSENDNYVDAEAWKKLLLQSGFTYANVSKSAMGITGCITATASSSNGYDEIQDKNALSQKYSKKWVLFANDQSSDMIQLVRVLHANGCQVTVILPAKHVQEKEANIALVLSSDDIHGIIYAWGMNGRVTDQKRIARPFLQIAQFAVNMKKPPKLYILTRNVHAVAEYHVDLNPSAATLFGMAKSLKNENPDMHIRCVDLEYSNSQNNLLDNILFELAMNNATAERERVQVAYRSDIRYEPRFQRASVTGNHLQDCLPLPPSTDKFQLVLPESRMIGDLKFDVLEHEPVGRTEVEVAVRAYGLNFRDIFTILKPSKEFESMNSVGLDFAGMVVNVGLGVSPANFKTGDRVFGANLKETQMPSHLVLEADNLCKIPAQMTFCEAATLPAAFATSFHCLMNIARMKSGDTVLIHTGSGGVGLCAIQLAKHVGAHIITTAGTPRKRAYLRSLGIQHVLHSRDTSYQTKIIKITNGAGVDIVLNSITGPGFKEASLSVCKKNARFVEMSKLRVWTEDEVKKRRPDVEYTIVDLAVLEPSTWKHLLKALKDCLNDGNLSPIPCVTFDALRLRQAFQYFQKAKHIGKVVVTMPEIATECGSWTVSLPLFNGESTYLITGGLGGIGFEVCKWMLRMGATNIVLIGRRSPKPHTLKEIKSMNSNPYYNINVKLGDIGNYEQCKQIIDDINQTGKPIRGIHHCAGVLRDNFYHKQTWDSFEEAFNAKVNGTWNLHNLTKGMSLEHFVFYSSVTALFGSPAQSNYAAANSFEDAFSGYRNSIGLPATSINWGQWSEVGCAKEISVPGVQPVSVKRMINGLETTLRNHIDNICFCGFESLSMWSMTVPMFHNYFDERFMGSVNSSGGAEVNTDRITSDQFWQEMDSADSTDNKIALACTYIKGIIRRVLRLEDEENISEDVGLHEHGVDSLMSIELKNNIQSLVGARLSVTAKMFKDCVTIRDMATVIVRMICDTTDISLTPPQLAADTLAALMRKDSILGDDIQPTNMAPCSVSTMKTVLVTGVTGQLGPYILSALCTPSYKSLNRIYCLVRAKEDECPQRRLHMALESANLESKIDWSRIECIRGDVALVNLGIAEKDYQRLADHVDGVIHLAVKSNHVEPYLEFDHGTKDIRSVNVGGTLNVLRFASKGKTKQIYHASSLLCVFGKNDKGRMCDDWPDETQIDAVAENQISGYPISKYIAELLLRQANERGIPCKVFRFPWIAGDSKTGQLNYMTNHYILRFLGYLKVKSMPRLHFPAAVLPVDICADLSLLIFFNDKAPHEIYNITHPNPQLEVEFVNLAKRKFSVKIELVDWKVGTFLEKLFDDDTPLEVFKELYEDVDRLNVVLASGIFQAFHGYLSSPENFFQNAKVEVLIPNYSANILSSMDILQRDLSYVKAQGFFDKFGL